jgi:hypothetical protein
VILHQNLTFQAKFMRGQLYIIDRSPDLPPFPDHIPLLVYLNMLSLEYFQVKQMAFEGFDLTVEMERMDDQSKPTPQYLVHMLAQTYTTPDMSFADLASRLKNRQQALNDDFSETIRRKGWSELAISKPLASNFEGMFFISIWRAQ